LGIQLEIPRLIFKLISLQVEIIFSSGSTPKRLEVLVSFKKKRIILPQPQPKSRILMSSKFFVEKFLKSFFRL